MERGKLHLDLKGWEGEFCSATITLQPPTANSKQEGKLGQILVGNIGQRIYLWRRGETRINCVEYAPEHTVDIFQVVNIK